eukprot:TRINITY_DN48644_c0_g1_i1.p1 TRINITY_DN48644_c0_g1~~TRINITY_DN48644_c0_g1_i1.p1  ORF type:complete len:554 (-),score=74.15 TRINITY_DN48644_c0_g1_i1:131-1792(-)
MASASTVPDSIVNLSSGQDVAAADISFPRLLVALSVIVLESICAHYLSLGIADQLLVAGIRAFVQLKLLGLILEPIFNSESACFTLGYIFGFMLLVSAYEAAARPKWSYPGILRNCVCSIGASLSVMMIVLLAVVEPHPWYSAHYLIPMAGMLINNALTGMAPALNMITDHFKSSKEQVETLLAFGATPWEAAWPGFVATFRQALIPSINGMNVIGLVSIPGMMTGQVLGGSPPARAVDYQIVITFLISGTTFLNVWLICALSVRSLFDARSRLLSNSMKKQSFLKIAQCLSLQCCRRKIAVVEGGKGEAKEALLADASPGVESVLEPLQLRAVRAPRQADENFGDVVLDLDFEGKVASSRPISVRLQLRAGEIGCLQGRSGIGKSTVLRLISDLEEPGAGGMTVRGRERLSTDVQAWRRDVLYVHQSKAPLPDCPRDLVRRIEGLKVNRKRPCIHVVSFLTAFGLSESFLDRPWSEISGGEAQRVMCAIAMSTRPACLLLDESTSALDEDSKKLVEVQLSDSNSAVLLVTHDENQATRVASSVWEITSAASL